MKKHVKAAETYDYDFDERMFAKLPEAVKDRLNDAWNYSKTNSWFSPYLTALVDLGIISEADRIDILKSNVSYGYDTDIRASRSSARKGVSQMKKYIRSSTLTEQFLKYHDDEDNYHYNHAAFDEMYKILLKYGDESEDVDVLFERAPLREQEKMLDMIKPDYEGYLG